MSRVSGPPRADLGVVRDRGTSSARDPLTALFGVHVVRPRCAAGTPPYSPCAGNNRSAPPSAAASGFSSCCSPSPTPSRSTGPSSRSTARSTPAGHGHRLRRRPGAASRRRTGPAPLPDVRHPGAGRPAPHRSALSSWRAGRPWPPCSIPAAIHRPAPGWHQTARATAPQQLLADLRRRMAGGEITSDLPCRIPHNGRQPRRVPKPSPTAPRSSQSGA